MLFSTLPLVVNKEFVTPSLPCNFTKDSWGKAFVNMSVIISLLETYSSLIFCCPTILQDKLLLHLFDESWGSGAAVAQLALSQSLGGSHDLPSARLGVRLLAKCACVENTLDTTWVISTPPGSHRPHVLTREALLCRPKKWVTNQHVTWWRHCDHCTPVRNRKNN